VLVPQGRFDEAHQSLAAARTLDPLSRSLVVSSAAAHYYERNADAAIADSQDALQLDDRFAMGYFFLGLALELKGERRAARVALEQARSLAPSAEILAALGHLHAAAGDRERAADCRVELEAQAAQRYQSPVLLAQIAAAEGRAEDAVRRLEQAQELHAADLIWIGVRPAFDPLRTLPAFASLHAARAADAAALRVAAAPTSAAWRGRWWSQGSSRSSRRWCWLRTCSGESLPRVRSLVKRLACSCQTSQALLLCSSACRPPGASQPC
jgi:tetratricopeptide (TPR) repeat protein